MDINLLCSNKWFIWENFLFCEFSILATNAKIIFPKHSRSWRVLKTVV